MQELKRDPEVKGNDLISAEEIRTLKAKPNTITLRDAMEMRLKIIIPMDLKSGYAVSYSIVESPVGRAPMEVLSVGTRGRPDPADSERIALAVLGEGYASVESLLRSGTMVHFWKRRG